MTASVRSFAAPSGSCDTDDRTNQVIHRPARRLAARDALFDVTRDALDNHDCIVNDDADRQHDRE